MKKAAIVAAAAVLSSGAAMAQQVSIYGIVDAGVAHITNVNAAGDSATKMPSATASVPSRIGFRGAEDLGNGLKATFALETGFGPDTGTLGQGGRLFGRQAWVGIKSDYGQLMLGRQNNMTFYSIAKADVMGPNIFSISSLDSYLPNSRSDNAVGYMGTFSELTVGATYSLGRDTSTAGGPAATGCAGENGADNQACRQLTALVSWDTKAFGVLAAYDVLNGGAGAAAGLTSSDYQDRRASFNGYAMVGATKIGAGLIARRTEALVTTKSDLYYLGVSTPLAPQWQLDAQVARLSVKDTGRRSTLAVVRASYLLSKRTAVHASIGHIDNTGGAAIALDAGGTVGAGLDQNGILAGIRHAF
ncbi:porin [Massilia cavernae]|uniref:Porin n=1 Tax=Massilia cavernae TaxID=2320864 RepID=A0A418XRA7_9BURK|nr:porin [Massilia cavernae]RJG14988.1 porin [Massilia cavernae]